MRSRAVRARLSGLRDLPHERRPQRDGLQPLHRDALLLEQLPVRRARVQLAGSGLPLAARPPAQPRRHRPVEGRHGEVHLLRAADPRRRERGQERAPQLDRRRGGPGLRADLCGARHHLRRSGRFRRADQSRPARSPRLPPARGARHRPRRDLPRPRRQVMSTVSAQLALIEERVHAAQGKGGRLYWVLLACAIGATGIGAYSWSRIIRFGMGETGLNRPVAWGVLITDFVFWVGIAHSGTLISAILFLFRARFRTAVYRVAAAMTVFAVATAGLFPIIHLGRPWFGYWILPYPNERSLWINFRSPLVWDAFAISTYLVVSSLFLLSGLVPDAAALRDATSGWRRRLYAMVSLGWRGTDEEWRHHSRAYLFFAAFATPLVISVRSVVSWDFAVSVVPGWHSTLFPPYFVAGAILSGVAMVLTLLVPLRRALGIEELVTRRHLDLLSRLVLLTSLIVTFSYGMEFVLRSEERRVGKECRPRCTP